jgi:hypothetical protein
MDGWMDGWTDGRTDFCINYSHYKSMWLLRNVMLIVTGTELVDLE